MLCDGHVPYFNMFLNKIQSLALSSGRTFLILGSLCSLFHARDKYMINKQLTCVSSYNVYSYGWLLLYLYVRD